MRLSLYSRGSKGLIVRADRRIWTGYVRLGEDESATGAIGSGDATVAGFAVGLSQGYTMPNLIRLAVACGAANVLSIGPAVFTKADVQRLMDQVVIEELSR